MEGNDLFQGDAKTIETLIHDSLYQDPESKSGTQEYESRCVQDLNVIYHI